MKPVVSVVIPARNAASHLPALFAGLARQRLAWGEFETIVVDNASSDDTATIARSAGVRLVYESRPGPAAARNAGIRVAESELVAFVDSDCIPRDGWLEGLVAALRDAPDVGCVGGRVVAAPPRTLLQRYAERRGHVSQEEALANPYLPWVLTANCCYHRRVLLELGCFDANCAVSGEDVDLAWRMQRELGLPIAFAPDAVVEHVHRTTLLGLWRQWVKYGWGNVYLAQRHPRPTHKPPTVVDMMVWIATRLAQSARATPNLLVGRSNALDVVAPLLEVFEQVAHRWGRVQARRVGATR